MGTYTDLKAKFKKEYRLRGQALLDDTAKMKTYEDGFQDITDSTKALAIAQLFRKKDYDEVLKQFKALVWQKLHKAESEKKEKKEPDAKAKAKVEQSIVAGVTKYLKDEEKKEAKAKADADKKEKIKKEKIKKGVKDVRLAAEQEKRKKMDEQMKENQAEEVPAGSKKEDTGTDEGELDLDKDEVTDALARAGVKSAPPDLSAALSPISDALKKVFGTSKKKDKEAEGPISGPMPEVNNVHSQGSETIEVAGEKEEKIIGKIEPVIKKALTATNIKRVVEGVVVVLAGSSVGAGTLGVAGTVGVGAALAYISYKSIRSLFKFLDEQDVFGLAGELEGIANEAKSQGSTGSKELAEVALYFANELRKGEDADRIQSPEGQYSEDAANTAFSPDLQDFYNVYTSMSRLEQLEVNMALGKIVGDVIGLDVLNDKQYLELPEKFRENVDNMLLTFDSALKDERYGPKFLEDTFRESLETLRTSPKADVTAGMSYPDIPVWVNQPESDVKQEFREMVDAMQRGTASARQYRELVGGEPALGVSEGEYLESIRLFLKKYPGVAFDPRVKELWRTHGLRYDAQESKFRVNRLTVNKDFTYYDVNTVLGEDVPQEVDMDDLQKTLTRPTEGQRVPPYDPSAPGMDDMHFGKPPEPTPQKLVPTDEITGEPLDEEGKPVEVPELLQRTGGSTNPFTSIALSQILLDVLRMDKKETQRVSKGLSEMYGKELPMVQQLQQAMSGQGVNETASRRGLYQMMRAVQNYEVKDSVGAIGYLQKKPQANAQLSAGIASVAGTMAGEAVGAGLGALGELMSNRGAPVKPADLDGIDLDLHMTKDGKLTPESIQRLQSATAGAGQDRRLVGGTAMAIKVTEYAVKYIMYQQAQAVQQGLYTGNFINNTKQSIGNISSLATYGEGGGGKSFMDVLKDTASNLASGNVSGIIDDWGNTFSSVGYALWDTDKAGVLQKLQGGIKARQARLADRQKAVVEHQKRMGTYYTNSGMTSFHRRGIPEHSIQEPPPDKKPFGVLADPRPIPNMTYQALRVLDTRSRAPPSGFKLRT